MTQPTTNKRTEAPVSAAAQACYYLRTSSATNVGGDSDVRQKAAIEAYAYQQELTLVRGAYDAAVSGSDPIHTRPGLTDLLDWMAKNEVTLLLVEDASRFSRDLMVQELGHTYLQSVGIQLIPVDAPESFTGDDDENPTRKLIRQILGALREWDKAQTVLKLRGARRRARGSSGKLTRAGIGKCEGRISLEERYPGITDRILDLREQRRLKWTVIPPLLYEEGYVSEVGTPISISRLHALHRAALRRESCGQPEDGD
jgi:DNA invertase Pin-like site-specific DNA recombinase